MGGAAFPTYVPATPPVSAFANPLTTTISSGAGTTTLTLAATARTSATNSTIQLDSGPAIFAAAKAAAGLNGTVYIEAVKKPSKFLA